MAKVSTGVLVDSLGRPAREGLALASRLGFGAVTVAPRGPLAPRELDRSGRRHLRKHIESLGLRLTGLAGDPGGLRFADPSRVDEYIEMAKAALEMAVELGSPLVTTPSGGLSGAVAADGSPQPANGLVAEAIAELARHAERIGAVLALHTGPEAPDRLAGYLRAQANPALKVAFDPAGLLLAQAAPQDPRHGASRGGDPSRAAEVLADHIVAVYARDVLDGREVPLGQGILDYRGVLGLLAEAGFAGVHTLASPPASRDPASDALLGRTHLESL